jgi:hypothetical protein
MGVRYWQDTTGALKEMYRKVLKAENERFNHLEHVKFNFTFRDPPDEADDGGETRIVAGRAKKLSPREHDIYGYNFEIEIAAEYWKNADEKARYRLMWHEMTHCQLEYEDDGVTPKVDKASRIKCYVVPHDISIRTFVEEARKFGLDPHERNVIRDLLAADEEYQSSRQKKLKMKNGKKTKSKKWEKRQETAKKALKKAAKTIESDHRSSRRLGRVRDD